MTNKQTMISWSWCKSEFFLLPSIIISKKRDSISMDLRLYRHFSSN